MNDNRVRILVLTTRALVHFFREGDHAPYRVVEDGLPGDAQVVGCEYDGGGRMRFYIWSATFEDVPEGEEPKFLAPYDEQIFNWPIEAPVPRWGQPVIKV